MSEIFILNKEIDLNMLRKANHCYIVARNGVFYKDRNKYMDTLVEVDPIIPNLNDLKPYIKWKYPKISARDFATIFHFFKEVNKKAGTECMVMIGWDRKKEEIVIFPPLTQTISAARIKYTNEETPGIAVIGTIHSHNTMSAFHSSIDIDDEIGFAGLHITIGKLTKTDNSFQISCQVTTKNHREDINFDDIIDGIDVKEVEWKFDYNPFRNKIAGYDISEDDEVIVKHKILSVPMETDAEMCETISEWMKTITFPTIKQKTRYDFNNSQKRLAQRYPEIHNYGGYVTVDKQNYMEQLKKYEEIEDDCDELYDELYDYSDDLLECGMK